MPKSSTSFQPGRSGNPGGRPKGVRTLARLIDKIGDEACAGTEEDFRTATMRRLWEAAATGSLNLGKSSHELKTEEWIRLVQWLVNHMDKLAIDQWAWQGSAQMSAEAEIEAAEYDVEGVEEDEEDDEGESAAERLAGGYDEGVIDSGAALGRLLVESVFGNG